MAAVRDHKDLARDLANPIAFKDVWCFHMAGKVLLMAAPSDSELESDNDSESNADALKLYLSSSYYNMPVATTARSEPFTCIES